MDSNFLSVLNHYRSLVWPEIEACLKQSQKQPHYCRLSPKYYPLSRFHHQLVSEYPRRQGKYSRPSLLLMTAQALDFPLKKALKTAAAMQLSEEWLLIHDDVEDNSLMRRGAPALQHQYSPELAVNAGDFIHALMWQILSENRNILTSVKTFAVIDEFSRMLNQTILGQTIEIKWTQENKLDLTDDDILLILSSKTGYYSIAGPMRLGAILAGASPQQLNHLYRFGCLLGYCYQIQDDLLDLTSDFAGLKKQTGNDIYEGKRTIMLAHLLRQASSKDKTRLLSILKKPRQDKSAAEVNWVINKMGEYGSLNYARHLMADFASQSRDYFDKHLGFLHHSPGREHLLTFIDFVTSRDH